MNARTRTTTRPKPKRVLPKEQQGKRTAFVVQFFAAAVCIAVVLLPFIWLTMTVVEKRELTQLGIQTTATITKHHSKIVYGAKGRSGESFLINYTFTPDDQAEEYGTDVQLPLDLWDTVRVGSAISVAYNPRNPSEHQPTMILKRLPSSLSSIIGICVGVLAAGVFIWFTRLSFRVITSRRRNTKASDPATDIAEGDTSKNSRSKKHRSQRDAPKTPMVKNVRGVLIVIAVLLGILAIFSMFLAVLVLGMNTLGPLVVEAMQNILL